MGTNKVTYNIPLYTGFKSRTTHNKHAMSQAVHVDPREGPLYNDMMGKLKIKNIPDYDSLAELRDSIVANDSLLAKNRQKLRA